MHRYGYCSVQIYGRVTSLCRNGPAQSLLVLGVRDESEVLYRDDFEKRGVEVIHALSAPSKTWTGFRGRVTDYLASLPSSWVWKNVDFYLCGNGKMVNEVRDYLAEHRKVQPQHIRQEVYFTPSEHRARQGKAA